MESMALCTVHREGIELHISMAKTSHDYLVSEEVFSAW